MDEATPRINGRHMETHLGRNVVLMCEFGGNYEQGMPIVMTPDQKSIKANLPVGEKLETRFVQLTGKVSSSNSLEVMRVLAANDDFDMGNYNKAVDLMMGQYSDLF